MDEHTQFKQRRQFLRQTWERKKAGNCGRLQLPHGLCQQGRQHGQWLHSQPFSAVTSTSFCLHVMGRKCHIEIFDLPFSGGCWLGLGIGHDIPGLLGRPALVSNNISRLDTHTTANTGRAKAPSHDVACVQQGA